MLRVDTSLKKKGRKKGVQDDSRLGKDQDMALLKISSLLLEFLMERKLVTVRDDIDTGA